MESLYGHSMEHVDNGYQDYYECIRCGLTATTREQAEQKARSVPCTSKVNRFE